MIYYYAFVAAFCVLMVYLAYEQVAGVRWDAREIRRIEQMELNAAHILRLLEAPDVRLILQNRTSRQDIFLEYSGALMEDIQTLRRLGRFRRPTALPLLALFFTSYHLLRAKARLLCGKRDLQFLSGLELALLRSAQD